MIFVIAKPPREVGNIETYTRGPADLLAACRKAWDDRQRRLGHGSRNAQATGSRQPELSAS